MDSYRLENCFDDLLNIFSERNTSAFSSCLFSVKTNISKPIDSFKKLIYNIGNQDEVYTKNERQIIETIPSFNICSEFNMYEKRQRVLCRLIAVDLSTSTSLIYDAISVMKICNKALDGFGIYILVGNDTIHIGCDMLGGESKTSCLISYPINNKINWESLLYTFSDIADDDGFLKYYYTLLNAILSVYNCYDETDENLYNNTFYHQFEDDEDRWYDPSDESLYHAEQDTIDDLYDSLVEFEIEVKDAKQGLDFIRSNRINSLEMLFDAEQQLSDAQEEPQSDDNSSIEEDEHYSENLHALLSNPSELIKALKNKNK